MKSTQSQHGDNSHIMLPSRNAAAQLGIEKLQASLFLGCDENEDAKEARRKHRKIARKNHLGKWCEQCNFSRSEGERVFKGIANAHGML